jgi:serine protease
LMDGTSMSCPHVTAVVGLLESYNPALTRQQKYDIITNPANMKPYNMTKYVGAGIVDARRCLDAAGGGCDVAADFSGSPTSGCAPLTVTFTDLSTGTGIDGWSWTFGDGGTSGVQNPSHQYANPGTYTVSLTASSSGQGCNDTQTKTGYITVQTTPVADFSGSPTSGYAPLTVQFTDLSTGNPDTWSWNFGDNGTSSAQNPSHVYQNAGTFTVTLSASNACGSDQAVKTGYITVQQPQQNSMHVSAMAVTRITQGKNATGRASVTIVDQNNNPLSGAVVYGYFNAPNTNTKTGTTGGDGVATISSDKTKSPPSDWCFTVTDVVLAGYTYDSGANVVTQACESGYVYSLGRHAALPAGYSLTSYPNPFNPTAKITFALPTGSHVRLDIFNIIGQKVTTLADGYFEAGEYSYEWDASGVASGIYLYRLTTDEFSQTRQMVLMK